MIKSVIVAISSNGFIGKNGKVPWHLPEDLRRFRHLTLGHPVIMGRKTYDSIARPLDGRTNIIITRNPDFKADGVEIVHSCPDAWARAEQTGSDEAFCIGGNEVYKQCIENCDRLYLTLVEMTVAGDVLFVPDLDGWEIVSHDRVTGTTPHQNFILERTKAPMARWLTLERLPDNDLPQPRYQTPQAAGLDFAACLTRPCKTVAPGGAKEEFWLTESQLSSPADKKPLSYCYRVPAKPTLQPEQRNRLVLSIDPGETVMIPLGFKCSFGTGVYMAIHVRSSIGLRGLVLANGTGIVDEDYRGDLFALVRNTTQVKLDVKHGERIVQGILIPYEQAIIRESVVDETARGAGGFGSTGDGVEVQVKGPQHK